MVLSSSGARANLFGNLIEVDTLALRTIVVRISLWTLSLMMKCSNVTHRELMKKRY